MKIRLSAAVAALAMAAATPVWADPIAFDFGGGGCTGGSTTCISLNGFDWSAGNSLLIKNAAGTAGTVWFQANLANLAGIPAVANGTGGNFFTETAKFDVALDGNGAFTVDSGTYDIWHNTTGIADDTAGTEFTAGALIVSAAVESGGGNTNFFTGFPTNPLDSFGSDQYTGYNTYFGDGSSSIVFNVLSANPAFFPDLIPGSSISFASTSLVVPFTSVNPSAQFFDGTPGVSPLICGNGGVLGPTCINGSGDHIMAQADAITSFRNSSTPVPEPASLFFLGTGLFGLVRARRARKVVATKQLHEADQLSCKREGPP